MYFKLHQIYYIEIFTSFSHPKQDLHPLVWHPENFTLWNCSLLNIPYYSQENRKTLSSTNDKLTKCINVTPYRNF